MTSSYQGPAGFDADELRAAVRAVLRDVLPTELARGSAPGVAAPLEHVTVRSDADLDSLVRRVAALCEDPTRRAALRDGRHGFRLTGDASRASGSMGGSMSGSVSPCPSGATSGIMRVDRGAVTERTVAKAAADGARLMVGPKAVLTPLARDKARLLGVEIEKER